MISLLLSRRILFSFLFFLAIIYHASGQCSMIPIGLDERVGKSSLIVEGMVTDQRSLWDDRHHNIYTIYTVEVTRIFKGNLNDTVVYVIDQGGTVGMEMDIVTNTLKLGTGKTGIFTLISSNKPVTSKGNLYEAYAGPQGFIKYHKHSHKAYGVFDHYTGLDNHLYKEIENRTQIQHKKVKEIKWNKVSDNESTTGDNHGDLHFDMIEHLTGDTLTGEIVESSISSTATISSFSPTTIEGGKAMILTINGSGFGASQGTSYVQFPDANYGGTQYYQPLATQYISWSDTKIEVEVPSRAGTGKFQISDGTNTKTASTNLTIDYSLSNLDYDAGAGTKAHLSKLQNDNGSGGYTFNCNSTFASNVNALTDITNILYQWKCASGVNWSIGANTTTNVDASDGINIIRFDSGSELSAGVLGQARSRLSGCLSGTTAKWYVAEIDVVVDDGTSFSYGSSTPSISQYDFYSVMLHEMGHAQQLAHVIDATKVMHYSLANATQRRTISTAETTGATYSVTNSSSSPYCSTTSMWPYSCTPPTVTLSVSSTSISETGGTSTVTAALSGVYASDVTVTLGLTGTATTTSDYTLGTTITVPAGTLSASITLSAVGDTKDENNETVIIDITAVTNGTESGTQQQTVTINDDDASPTVTLSTGATSISETGGSTNVTATLSAVSGLDVTVTLSLSGTATITSDYTLSTTITVPAGSSSASITLTAVGDTKDENDETVIIDISAVTNGSESGTQQKTVTITDDDTAPTVTLSTGAASIGETGGTTTVTATLSAVSGLDVTVTLTLSGTATITSDYTLGTTITVPAGSSSASITLSAVGDTKDENDETVIIDISAATNGTESGTQQQTVTITDDDAAPTVTLSTGATSISETGGSTTVVATLSAISGLDVSVTLTLSGTATVALDYSLTTTILIPAGSTSATLTLSSVGDTRDENDETIIIDITGVSNGTESGIQQKTVTITDDDPSPTVTLSASATTISETGGTSTITATSSAISNLDVTVTLTLSGTATVTSDYTLGTSIVIPAGSTTASITLNTLSDTKDENDETVIIDITGVSNGTESGTQQQTITISDDDPAPTVTLTTGVSSISETGGNTTVTSTLSAVSGLDVTVTLTLSGSATLTSDYTVATTIIVPAGSSSASITLSSTGDTKDENDETVIIDINTVTNGTESGIQQKTVTITDDDAAPTVTLSTGAVTISETSGTTTFTATLSAVSGLDVTVGLGITGTATIATDYTLSGTTIFIPAGSTSASVTLNSISDTKDEADETIIADITSVINGTESGVQQKTLTIMDDDAGPSVTLSASVSSLPETGGSSVITATLSEVSDFDVTVTLTLTGTATSGTDYSASSTSILIPAGSTTATASVYTITDTDIEGDETIIVDVSSVTNGSENGVQRATLSLIDDDFPTFVSITTSSANISETGGAVTITATLSDIVNVDVTVNLGYTGTASGTDYSVASTIIIPTGSSSASIVLTAVSDIKDENDETIIIDIVSVQNGSESGTQQQTITILDDDLPPTVTLTTSAASIAENGGTANLIVTLSSVSELDVTVSFSYTGTATNVSDYTRPSTLIIPAGSLSASTAVTAVDDSKDESNESVIAKIATATNGTIATTQQKTITILDDDPAPSVTLSATSPAISETGGTTSITATLSAISGLDVTVNLTLSGTGAVNTDYTVPVSITILAGNSSASITLYAVGDLIDEDDETAILDITGVTNGVELGIQKVTVTVTDDDLPPTVTISSSPVSISENGGISSVTATLSAVSSFDVIVNLASSGTASYSTDYSVPLTITIQAGSISASINLSGIDDVKDENDETVVLTISSAVKATVIGSQQTSITITDDDLPPTVTLSTSLNSLSENNTTLNVSASLSQVSELDVTVTLGMTGTANVTADYSLSSTIVIPAGQSSASITLTTVDDVKDENDETVIIDITLVNNGTESGVQQKTITILDDDAAPSVTLSSSLNTINETSGTSTITATLSAVSELDVTVNLALSGTASVTKDFTLQVTLTIPAGSTYATITLNSVDDLLDENNETVVIDINTINNGTESGVQKVTVTITDNDLPPTVTLSANPLTISETGGTSSITATLSAVSGLNVTVQLAVSGTTSSGDYSIPLSITIPAGNTSAYVNLTATSDVKDENNETVIIDINAVTNGTESGVQQKTVTINDDDPAPSVVLSSSTTAIDENASASIMVTISAVSELDVTVNFVLTGFAQYGTDYTMPLSLTIPAGSLTGSVNLVSTDDLLDERNETVIITVSSAANGTIASAQQQSITINDNDLPPLVVLSADEDTISETGGTTKIYATLSVVSSLDVTIQLAVTGNAVSGVDYNFPLSITIPAGSLNSNVSLTSIGDLLYEKDENVTVDVVSATDGTEDNEQQVSVTISDDEPLPLVSLSMVTDTLSENSNGTNLNVNLNAVSGLEVTVKIKYSGSATNSLDYTADTIVVIPAGQTSKQLPISINNDARYENTEIIIVSTGSISNGASAYVSDTLVITNDDAKPQIVINSSSSTIDENGGSAVLHYSLSEISDVDVKIDFTVTGTAVEGADFSINKTSIIIPAGSLSDSLIITSLNDNQNDDGQTIIISVSSVDDGVVTAGPVTLTIADDDNPEFVLKSKSGFIENDGNYDLGNVKIGTTITDTLYIINNGTYQMSLTDADLVKISGQNFQIDFSNLQSTIAVGDSIYFTLQYTSICGGNTSADIIIPKDDNDESDFGFSVAVNPVDLTAPVPLIDSIEDATGLCQVTISAPLANDNCNGQITATTSDPTIYTGQGQFVVTWVFTDASGNFVTRTQKVIVQDTIAPEIVCPSNQVVQSNSATVVNYTNPAGTDNCVNPSIELTDGLASGSLFPLGTTPVSYKATDVAGNTATCQFDVTINNTVSGVQMSNENNARIYPNPATSTVNIELITEVNEILVLDATGSILQVIEKPSLSTSLDLSSYSSGMYMIRFVSDSGVVNKKVNLQK